MAVINRNKGTGNNTMETTDTTKSTTSKSRVVDIFNDKSLPTGSLQKLDSSGADDAWGFGAPPPMGYYDLKPLPAKDGVVYQEEYEYYSVNLECRIQSKDPDYDNIPVFSKVTTRIGRGKTISTMGALIVKLGFKVPDTINDLDLTKMLMMALKKEKILFNCFCDWNAGYKDELGNWKNPYSTMTSFPQNGDGSYQHEFTITIKGGVKEPIRAQLKVVEFGDSNVEKSKARMKSKESVQTVGKPNGGIQLSKSAGQGSQTELVLEDESASTPGAVEVVEVSESDLQLAEA